MKKLILLVFSLVLNFVSSEIVQIPPDFRFGAATASYQIEGAWNKDGKLPNIWDTMSHKPGAIFDGSTGDEAANSYEFYPKDVQALKETGFSFYRFSISWSRVLTKNLQPNQAGIDYYHRLIDELINNGIEPLVTMYHWDLPQYIQDLGGWPNPNIVQYFEVYADLLYKNFGKKVRKWITFNEPWVFCKLGYAWAGHAPQINRDKFADYLCGHHMLLSHSAAYHLYNEKYRSSQGGEVGICLDTNYYYPMNENVTQNYIERALNFKVGWFSHVIFSKEGGYPQDMREPIDRKSREEGRRFSRLPEFTDEQRTKLIGAADFLAINYYTSRMVIPYFMDENMKDWTSDDDLYSDGKDPSWEVALSDWLFDVPQGIYDILMWIKNSYDNPKVMISENGWSDSGTLEDDRRIKYFEKHIAKVLEAKRDGCNVEAFTAWSIIDNFEWARGYSEHFGLYKIAFDSPNKERTAKKSALFFRDMLRDRSFNNTSV